MNRMIDVPLSLGLAVCVALLSVVAAPTPAGAQSSDRPIADELIAREAAWLHGLARQQLPELLDMAGDFGGYGGVLFEVVEQIEPPPSELEGILRSTLFPSLDPAVAGAVAEFWGSQTGRKILWLRQEATTQSGRRGLARSVNDVAARIARDNPDRYADVTAIDAASIETETTLAVTARLFQFVDAAANRIQGDLGDEAEWAQSPAEIRDHFRGPFREQLVREFVYRTSRLSAVEIADLHAFAHSDEGRAYFEARRAALEAGAAAIVDTLLPRAHGRLDGELREYAREREEEEGEGDEDR
ncbi:MAG: hypothetical protein AAGM22_20860 [Acidobacteriota bacterium]